MSEKRTELGQAIHDAMQGLEGSQKDIYKIIKEHFDSIKTYLEIVEDEPPFLVRRKLNKIEKILSQCRDEMITDLKSAKISIKLLNKLDAYVEKVKERQYEISQRLKAINERMEEAYDDLRIHEENFRKVYGLTDEDRFILGAKEKLDTTTVDEENSIIKKATKSKDKNTTDATDEDQTINFAKPTNRTDNHA